MDELEARFKEVYRTWEEWARTGDPRATRQELVNGLLEVVRPLLLDQRRPQEDVAGRE